MKNVKKYGLNKLTITENQQELVLELVKKKVSGKVIANKIGMSQSKMWRQMEMMGVNKKKNKKIKKNKKNKVFSWEDFKNNSVI